MAELKDLQALVAKTRSERGFMRDPVRMYALLNEEIGEIGGELKGHGLRTTMTSTRSG